MTIPQVARRARRRLMWNEAFAQGTYALSAGLGGVVLLLLLGTQILDWRWLVALPAGMLGYGVFAILRRLPGLYATAQLIDRRLGLADTVSTALYFGTSADERRSTSWMREAQLAQAERVAERVDARKAVPFKAPRALYAAGLLAFIATSLFALRYGLERRLDLRPPLASILLHSFDGNGAQVASLQKKRPGAKRSPLEEALGLSTDDGSARSAGELDGAPDSALDTAGIPDTDNSKKGKSEASAKGNTPAGEATEGEPAEGESADNGAEGQNGAEGKQGGAQQKQGDASAGNDSNASSGNSSSLVSKLRDAMSNLLSRMKQQPQGGGSQQQSAMNQNGQQAGQKGSGQKGRPGQGKQQGGKDADSQEGEQGQDAENAQNAQGRGAGQSADDQASKQPGSGIGKQDGSKDVKLAEQLAAMGKISEIIGKRSANVTGDVTVEVQSSSQQLKTAWVQQSASHGNASGEINRDEVPVELQTYVRRYFEQVRKAEGKKAAGKQ
jgi:hypothetical protein